MTIAFWSFVLRVSLAVIVVWAGTSKLVALDQFAGSLMRYRLLPTRLVRGIAVVTVAAELGIGGGLLVSPSARPAAAAAALLFGIFAVSIAITLRRGVVAPCNCFGLSANETISVATLVRAILLLSMSGVLLGIGLGSQQALSAIPRAALVPALMIAVASAFVVRLAGFVPEVWRYWRTAAELMPTTSHRVSFRHQPYGTALAADPSVEDPHDHPGRREER